MKSGAPAYIMNSRGDLQSPIALKNVCGSGNEVMYPLFILPVGSGRVAALLKLYAVKFVAQTPTHREEKIHEELIALSVHRFGICWVNVSRIPQMVEILLPRIENGLIAPRTPSPSQTHRPVEREINHVQRTHVIGVKTSPSCGHQRMEDPQFPCTSFTRALHQFLRLHRKYWSYQRGRRNYPVRCCQVREAHSQSSLNIFLGGILA